MPEGNGGTKRLRVLIVEDDREFLKKFGDVLERSYAQHLEIEYATDAGSALEKLRQSRPPALILDLMMPYGDAGQELGSAQDPDEWNTGLELLAWLRQKEQALNETLVWVAIVTARSPLAVHARAEQLLGGRGRVYYKPFDTMQLESDLTHALGIPCNLLEELLQDDAPRD